MVVRYVSFNRLVHVLVKWFPLRHGSRDYHKLALHVLFIEFCPCFVYWLALMGEVLPVVCEMTSPTTWFGGDDHNSVILVTGLSITSSCLARFRQLFVTWLPQPDGSRDDPKYCSREVYRWPAWFCMTGRGFASCLWHDFLDQIWTRELEGWPQMFSREVHWLQARLCQGEISPVSYLWHDFLDQRVQGMITNVFHVRFIDYRQYFARVRFRQLFVTWLPRPDGLRDDHKDVIQVRILGGISPIGCQARHSVVRMSEISPQSLCWISNIWAKFRQWPMKSYSCSKFIWICGRDFARVRPRARFRQLFVK